MKILSLLIIILGIQGFGFKTASINNYQNRVNKIVDGPSSVATLSSEYNSQKDLDIVFKSWLNQFKYQSNSCLLLTKGLDKVNRPILDKAEIVIVEVNVYDLCKQREYSHKASFELVVLENSKSSITHHH